MVAIEIENIKKFMSELFMGNTFDRFLVRHCEIVTYIKIEIDGERMKEWYDTEERSDDEGKLIQWQECRPIIFEWIKGEKPPLKMKLDFCYFLENGDTGSLRIEYTREALIAYTGYVQKEFSLDKQGQQDWDRYCGDVLEKNFC